jgi:hypothetical protein
MTPTIKVLWIEDAARFGLAYLTAPIYLEGGFELTVAENASDAQRKICEAKYDIMVVDIRLPPGSDYEWIKVYEDATIKGLAPNLGLKILTSIFKPAEAEVPFDCNLDRLTPDKIGVFTIERSPELLICLKDIGIKIIERKTVTMPDTTLLNLIKRLCEGSSG